jgi:hypothetical protein
VGGPPEGKDLGIRADTEQKEGGRERKCGNREREEKTREERKEANRAVNKQRD